MSQKKLFKDLSASTIQTVITQLAGLIIFYLMSRYINKEEFGSFQWSTAVGSTIIAIGSLGLDLVLVKRIAAGTNWKLISSIHFFHSLLISVILVFLLLILQFFYPTLLQYHPFFLLVFIQLILTNVANSFKFSLTGLEAFQYLAIVAIVFNTIKLLSTIVLLCLHLFTMQHIVIGFIACSTLELFLSYYFISKQAKTLHRPIIDGSSYKAFIYESLPQLGVVLFDSALARIDWILLGIYSTAAITAEYSFAYKFFELSKLPLLIIGPILLTKFTKLFTKDNLSTETQTSIQNLFNLELFISMLIPIFMVICWSASIDYITNDKYGAVNEYTFSVLAICIPIHFIINFYWTLGFIQGQLKEIMWITIGASTMNLLLNTFMIPHFGGIGAAIAFLCSSLAQLIAYTQTIKMHRLNINLKKTFVFFISAVTIISIFKLIDLNVYLSAILACILYICLGIGIQRNSIFKIKNLTT